MMKLKFALAVFGSLFAVAGMLGATVESSAQGDVIANPDRGRDLFSAQCSLCHVAQEGDNGGGHGPNLIGIVGRVVGGDQSFSYSPALASSDSHWTDASLRRFLEDPGAMFSGNMMPMNVPEAQDRADIMAYLRSLAPAEAESDAGGETGAPLAIGSTLTDANIRTFGSIINAESCAYDPARQLIVVPSRGVTQDIAENDAFVSFISSDGSVHTPFWLSSENGASVLNHPYGSEISDGKLYLADLDGGTSDGTPMSAVIRVFDMADGVLVAEYPAPQIEWINDIAVATDGTIYATQTRDSSDNQRLYRISANGDVELLVDGAPLANPNGVAIDNSGNVVVVNIGNAEVLTFSPDGDLIGTELAAQPGNGGLVIMPDGTKYISSVRNGGISRIVPGQAAELLVQDIPTPASMCFDPTENQLVVPMNNNNGLTFISIQ